MCKTVTSYDLAVPYNPHSPCARKDRIRDFPYGFSLEPLQA